NPLLHYYLCVFSELEDESTKPSAVELKYFIITGLKNVFGEVGAGLDFDVLKYSEDTLTAFLRVPSRGLVKLWSSLTLLGSYQNQACAFRVLQEASLAKTFSAQDVELFARLTGDTNPLHLDAVYARTTSFQKPLVHGILVNGLISAVIGARMLGRGHVLLHQDIRFPAPVFIGEEIVATAKVRRVKMSLAFLTVSCSVEGKVVMEGEVTVMMEASSGATASAAPRQ
ncbi:unnamed protein product, partial [Tetraodon nigroviridis]